MNGLPFSKINKDLSLSEKIEQQILEAIRQKIFLAGDKLIGEMELANNFGVSRTAVREALHRLAGRGVVEIKKNTGVFVSPDQYSPVTDSLYHLLEMKCGKSSLQNIANVRLILEPEIARLAANHRSDEDIVALAESYARMESNSGNPREMIKYDIDFHRGVAKAAQNPILLVIMEPLFQLMSRFISDTYEYPQSPALALKSHSNIFKNIEIKDGDGAFMAMRQHLEEAKDHATVILHRNNNRPDHEEQRNFQA
jgi:GntR family transcriptional regulator, transcriptional repressor for pyruvate dehydrogenase complex